MVQSFVGLWVLYTIEKKYTSKMPAYFAGYFCVACNLLQAFGNMKNVVQVQAQYINVIN